MTAGLSRRQALSIGGIGAAALAVGAGVVHAEAATTPPPLGDITDAAPVPDQVGGCAGLIAGQVARLSFHVRFILGESPPDPCDVAIRLRNLLGVVVAESVFTNVAANRGGFVDFTHPAKTLFASSGIASRIQLVGEIEHTVGYTVGGTLEIVDANTGATHANIAPCVIPAPTLVDVPPAS
jgi:hypothetical protein